MKTFIGTKVIKAEPCAKNYGPPEGHGQPGYTVVYADGYTSWSPAAAFEEAYRPCNAMTFGFAVEAMKKGLRVARAGWNGKGMWLCFVAYSCNSEKESHAHYHHHGIAGVKGLPWIGMKTADNCFVPWLASQTDLLAEDWVVLT